MPTARRRHQPMRRDVSAADVARSLLTGRFEPAGEPTEASRTRQRPASGRRDRAPSRTALSSSSLSLPGVAAAAASRNARATGRAWRGSGIRSPMRSLTLMARGSCTATSSRRTCCSTRRGPSGWPTSAWPRPPTSKTSPTPATCWAPCGTCPPRRSAARPTARGDIYSLGLTLYEMLAFRPAFDERDRGQLVKQVTTEEPPRLEEAQPRGSARPGDDRPQGDRARPGAPVPRARPSWPMTCGGLSTTSRSRRGEPARPSDSPLGPT